MVERPSIEVVFAARDKADFAQLKWRIARTLAAHGVGAHFTRYGSRHDGEGIGKSIPFDSRNIVMVAGGDVTVRGVARSILDHDVALGIVPVGPSNRFAQDLGLPYEVEGAVATLLAGRVARLDVAAVNGRIFINHASLGLYPANVVETLLGRQPCRRRWLASWAVLKMLGGRRSSFRLHLEVDGRLISCTTQLIVIANNRYSTEAGSFASRERLDEGNLAVYISRRSSRGDLLKLAFRMLAGGPRGADEFDVCVAREVRIEEALDRRCLLAVDGEPDSPACPLHFEIRPAALRVLVPSNRAKAEAGRRKDGRTGGYPRRTKRSRYSVRRSTTAWTKGQLGITE